MSNVDVEGLIEGLYDEMKEKIESTRSILQLSRVPQKVLSLVKNGC